MNYLPNEIDQYADRLTYQSTAYTLGALYQRIIQVEPWREVSNPSMQSVLKPEVTDIYLRLNRHYYVNITSGQYYDVQIVTEFRNVNVTTCYVISNVVDTFNAYVQIFNDEVQ